MKFHTPYTPFDRYILRNPTLSVDFYRDLVESENLEVKIKEVLEQPLVNEAIFLATPILHEQALLWKEGKIRDTKKSDRIKNTLFKYLIRMSSRCTPFGLFAGCGVGKIGNIEQIEIAKGNQLIKNGECDMHLLANLANDFANRKHIKKQLRFFPNSTLYRLGDRYRYVEYSYQNKKREHSIESVLYSEYLASIIKAAKNGTLLSGLVDLLVSHGFEQEESTDYIEDLVNNQILVSELELTVTGKNYLLTLYTKLASLQGCEQELEIIKDLIEHQKKLSCSGFSELTHYYQIRDYISSLKLEFEPKYLFQIDSYNTFKTNVLSDQKLREIKRGMAFLNRFYSERNIPAMEQFKKDFVKRYESKKMPLLQVLDIESGIGYGVNRVEATPFLDDIVMPEVKKDIAVYQISRQESILSNKYKECLKHGSRNIELKDSDFKDFPIKWNTIADSLSAMVELVSEDGREKVVMDGAGAHALRLLGRFANGHDDIMELVRDIAKMEESMNPEVILAEIVHIPESRTGNILKRPHLRDYEIPCLGFSNLPRERQIDLQDLWVSVVGQEIVLESKRVGSRILPRLSNAHNYSQNPLPVYQFLCDLQHQGQRGFYFSWGNWAETYSYLPRVSYGDIILSKERWKMEKGALDEIFGLSKMGNTEKLLKMIEEWRKKWQLPQYVELVEGDNTLLIKLDHLESVSMLLDQVKTKEEFVLQEVIGLDNQVVQKNKKGYRNEFVICFHRDAKLKHAV